MNLAIHGPTLVKVHPVAGFVPLPLPLPRKAPLRLRFALLQLDLQLASLETTVKSGDGYSALQRYKALFSRCKSNADEAILILSTVSHRLLSRALTLIHASRSCATLLPFPSCNIFPGIPVS